MGVIVVFAWHLVVLAELLGKIVKLWVDARGIPMIEIEPVPKGRKKNRSMSLYRIRHLKATTRVAARYLFDSSEET
jgi:hypothetical protein